MDRVLDCFVAIYDTPDWCKCCLLKTAHSMLSDGWSKRLLPIPR